MHRRRCPAGRLSWVARGDWFQNQAVREYNIKIAGPLISQMPEAYALADKTSSALVAFAETGDPNTPKLPRWSAYSAQSRETMLFNNECRVESDPDRGPRLAMERVLKLS
jgi:carboxylesterase type B